MESLLFINERPLEITEVCEVIEVDGKDVQVALDELISDYSKHDGGVCILGECK